MQFGPGDQPYLTSDSILAFALYLAFTPFSDETMPCVNYYKPEDLRALGYKGMKPLEAAAQAVKDGRKGTVEYMFRMPEQDLMRVFEDQKEYLDKAEGLARDAIKNLIEDYKNDGRSYEETIVRLVCTLVYTRADFITMWQKLIPLLRLDDINRVERKEGDATVVNYGGFRFVSANASDETKKRLGL